MSMAVCWRLNFVCSMRTDFARRTRTPFSPLYGHGGIGATVSLPPKISSPRRTTSSLGPALTTTPLTAALVCPSVTPVKSIEIAVVLSSVPKAPWSIALISPPAAVLLMVPAKVLHGAVREHGLASSPTPETYVRVAWAFADGARIAAPPSSAAAVSAARLLGI